MHAGRNCFERPQHWLNTSNLMGCTTVSNGVFWLHDLQSELHSWWCAVAQTARAVLLSRRLSSELSLFDSLCPCNWCCRPCTGCDLRRGCCCSCPGGGPCELRWGCCSCLGGGPWHGLLARGVWCNLTDLQGAKMTCHKQATECVQSHDLGPQHNCLAKTLSGPRPVMQTGALTSKAGDFPSRRMPGVTYCQ